MSAQRPVVDGKFIRVGNERFWVRGVTYGAFEPNSRGELFPELSFVDRDFRQMRLAHVNTILTYTVPSIELLDLAHRHGMHAVTVISTRRSGELSIASTVVRAGLFAGKYLPYSSL